jgi:hypothetical protein
MLASSFARKDPAKAVPHQRNLSSFMIEKFLDALL